MGGGKTKQLLGAYLLVIMGMLLSSCGPTTISALGNPGDYCTEDSSCTDGTSCRAVEDGYRCMGNEEASRASKARKTVPPPVRLPTVVDDDPSSSSSTDSDDDEEAMNFGDDDEDEYVPPSRRRRGKR